MRITCSSSIAYSFSLTMSSQKRPSVKRFRSQQSASSMPTGIARFRDACAATSLRSVDPRDGCAASRLRANYCTNPSSVGIRRAKSFTGGCSFTARYKSDLTSHFNFELRHHPRFEDGYLLTDIKQYLTKRVLSLRSFQLAGNQRQLQRPHLVELAAAPHVRECRFGIV